MLKWFFGKLKKAKQPAAQYAPVGQLPPRMPPPPARLMRGATEGGCPQWEPLKSYPALESTIHQSEYAPVTTWPDHVSKAAVCKAYDSAGHDTDRATCDAGGSSGGGD